MKCPSCGVGVTATDHECPLCGAALTHAPDPPPGGPPPPPPSRPHAAVVTIAVIVMVGGLAAAIMSNLGGSEPGNPEPGPTGPTSTTTSSPLGDTTPEPPTPPPASEPPLPVFERISGVQGYFHSAGTLTETTSEPFLRAVAGQYALSGAEGASAQVTAYSPVTQKSYDMTCIDQGNDSVICEGGKNAKILLWGVVR